MGSGTRAASLFAFDQHCVNRVSSCFGYDRIDGAIVDHRRIVSGEPRLGVVSALMPMPIYSALPVDAHWTCVTLVPSAVTRTTSILVV